MGPDGALWFTETGAHMIGRITTGGVLTEYPVSGSGPNWIVVGPDGNLWFTELFHDKIGRITTSGVWTEEGHEGQRCIPAVRQSALGLDSGQS